MSTGLQHRCGTSGRLTSWRRQYQCGRPVRWLRDALVRGRGVGLAVLLAGLVASLMSVAAQSEDVSLDGFDRSGLEVVVLAIVEAGGSTTQYSAADSRWGASGTLVAGDLELADGSSISRIMTPESDGSLLRFNDDGPLSLRDYFGGSGDGSDLTIHVQTASGTARFAASDVDSAGNGYINVNVPASARDVLAGIESGDRFLLAFTRPAPVTEPDSDPEADNDPEPGTDSNPLDPGEEETEVGDSTGPDDDGFEDFDPVGGKRKAPISDRLDSELNRIAQEQQVIAEIGAAFGNPGTGSDLRRDTTSLQFPVLAGTMAVEVFFDPAQRQSLVAYLRLHGANVRDPLEGMDVLIAQVPASLLEALATHPAVVAVRLAERPVELNQGARSHNAHTWQGAGVRGDGVRIGVIDTGFSNYTQNMGTNVPSPSGVRCYTSDVNVQHTSIAACETASSGGHGTRVIEMVYDVAPDAEYYLAVEWYVIDIARIINWFIDNDVDVLVMSLGGSFQGPGDGTSPDSHTDISLLNTAIANGITVVVAAGNSHNRSWYGTFTDGDGDDVLEWQAGDECNSIHLVAGTSYQAILRWDGSWTGASTDLDLYVTRGGVVQARSEDTQNGGSSHDPTERLIFTASRTGSHCVVVQQASSDAIPAWSQLIFDGGSSTYTLERKSDGYSIYGPAENTTPGFLTVGAASYNRTSRIEPYSSRGPLPSGAIKPDIVGATNLRSSVTGSTHAGTSMAAPHVGGLAALVKERFPWYTPAEVAGFLTDAALPRGDPVPNNTWGYGYAYLGGTPLSGTIPITGTLEVGATLTATARITDADGYRASAFRWRWYRVDGRTATPISGATSRGASTSTYVLTSDDEGKKIIVKLEYSDRADNHEEMFSSTTDVVLGEPEVFISNIDHDSHQNHITLIAGRKIAQYLHTGQSALGYQVRRLQIDVRQALPSSASYSVGIWSAINQTTPGALLFPFRGSLTSTGKQTFEPVNETVLENDTTYFLVIEVTSLGGAQPLVNAYVDYKDLSHTVTRAAGWQHRTQSYYRSSGDTSWTRHLQAWGMAIRGDAVPADNSVSFRERISSVDEGETVQVWLDLDGPAGSSFTVPVILGNETTAQSGDYSGIPVNVTFDEGDTSQSFDFTAVQDSEDDDNELVYLVFGTMPDGITAVTPDFRYLTITDDDDPEVTVAFGALSYDVDEGDDVAVTVELSAIPERRVVIPIEVYGREEAAADPLFGGDINEYASSATDYSGVPSTITFASDQTQRTFTFTATEEMVDDDDEIVEISFGDLPDRVTADTTVHSGEAGPREEVTISLGDNDDPPVEVRFGSSTYSVTEGATVLVSVELDVAPERQVVIPLETTLVGGASQPDYLLAPSSSVTFGATDTRKTLSFTARTDTLQQETGEGVTIAFGSTLPAGVTVDTAIPTGQTVARDTTTVTITNAASVPGAPSIDSITGSFRRLDVNWSAPANNGGRDISGYNLRYILSSESSTDKADPANWTIVTNVWVTGGGELTNAIRGLRNGSSYDVQVRAKNSEGSGAWSATRTGRPFIANHDPEFQDGETAEREIREDAAVGANIGAAVSASDRDSSVLSYALEAEHDLIAVNERTGQLTVKAALDRETAAEHVVTVTVSDLASPNGIANEVIDDTIEVTITVTNVNEPPVIGGDAAITVAENSTGVLDTYVAVDPEGIDITEWSLRGSDADKFTISATGELSFSSSPDYDEPGDADGDNVYNVRVRATEGSKVGRFNVVVTVTNVDEAPVIDGSASVDFAENGSGAVGRYSATDPEGLAVFWRALSGPDAAQFVLLGNGDLSFLTPPDYEDPVDVGSDNTYNVTLTAADHATTGLTSTLDLTIRVTAVNEPPLISGSQAPNLTEDDATAVGTYTVSDPESANSSFTWSLQGPDRSLFTLTSSGTPATSATLAFNSAPDFESPADAGRNNEYDVTLRVVADDSTAGTLRLLITVRNDNDAPTITGGPTTISVAEDVTGVIATYTATDPERATIQWSLGGTDAADFTIDSQGRLSFANGADAETKTSHSITVIASDGDATNPLTATRNVAVSVTNVDEPAEITPDGNIEVDENSSATLRSFTATDPEGDNVSIVWSLSGADASDFTLSSAGALSFSSPPDFESPADADSNNIYEITVEAGGGSLELTVTVRDVNEPPTISPTGDLSRVENSTGTVARYTAVDPEGVTDTFTWSLSGDDAADFVLHPSSGSLVFAEDPDYDDPADADQNNVYEITVEVTDGDLSSSINVEVTVTNIDEPLVINGDATITKAEGFAGTLDTYTASDPEGVTAFTWSLAGVDRDDFTLNAGVLAFAQTPDYDNPTDANRDNVYAVTVRANDGANTVDFPVEVTVTNIDETPVVSGPEAITDFPENSPITRVVGSYSATDPDRQTVTWSALTGDDADAFELSSSGVLTFKESPDQESQDAYAVTINASDGTNTGSLDVEVLVSDVNEPPVVARQTGSGAFSIAENSGTGVGSFTATDPENQAFGWSLGGADAADFEISSAGALSFVAEPDHDNPQDSGADNTYNVTIRATEVDDNDANTRELTGTLEVVVRVTGVNEPPVVSGPETIADYPENSSGDVGRYTVSDPEDGGTSWSPLSGTDAASFELSSAGVLTFREPPDHESKSTPYEVTINASDGVNTASLVVSVTVTDVNEAPVVSRKTGSGAFSLEENSGTAVGSFDATDPEGGLVEWSLSGSDANDFEIGSAGELSFAAEPNHESPQDSGADNTYNLTVRATEKDDGDAATQELTGTLNVVVRVTDVDEPPVISAPSTVVSGAISHAENRTSNAVATFTVRDPERRSVVWQALAGDDAAQFSFDRGALSFLAAPDFEAPDDDGSDNSYQVSVRASDGANSVSFDLTVRVTNVDEQGALTLSAAQPQTGTALSATLTDPDTVGATTWIWQRSTSRTSGWTTISGETANSYTPQSGDLNNYLRVQVSYTDGHGSGKSLSAVTDNRVQEPPPSNTAPVFSSATANRSIAENSAANSNVGAPVTAADAEDSGDLTYSLSGSSLFTIVATSGQIRVASGAVLDHEDDDEHTVTVTATDPSALTDSITVTIEVSDVNEPPTAGDDSVSTNEDIAVTFGVLGNDSDPETASGDLTVSIGSVRPANGAVTLNSATKQFTYTPNADFHGADRFTYNLSDGSNRVTGSVLITVSSVNDLPEFPSSTAQRSVSEAADVGDRVGIAVTATDGDHASLSYSMSGAADFAIDENTGQITVAAALDHETTDTYNATVTAEDAAGAEAEVAVTITVTNVNEPPTAVDDAVAIDEDGTARIDVLGNDTDVDTDAANLSVSLVSGGLSRGTATVDSSTKEIVYAPNLNANGLEVFQYRVTDDGGNRDTGTVRVTIRPINDPPEFRQKRTVSRLDITVSEGASAQDAVGAPVTAHDPDQDGLTYDLSGPADNDFDIDPVTAQLFVRTGATIDREQLATYDGTVTASDSNGGSDSLPIRINVSDVPEPPVVGNDNRQAVEDTPLSIDVLSNDTDPDTLREDLRVQVVRQPAYGLAEVETEQTITYTPNLNSNSRDSFEYRVSDGSLSDTGFVYITEVTPVNDAPVFPLTTIGFEVSEDSEPGQLVGYPVAAFDVDQDTLTYTLGGPDSALFEIDPDSGQITTTGFFDSEQQETHELTVTATDSASPSLTATTSVTVTVVVGTPTQPVVPLFEAGGQAGGQAGGGIGGGGGGFGGGGGGGAPAVTLPSEEDFDYNVTRDLDALERENGNPTGLWSDGDAIWVLNNATEGPDSLFVYDLNSGERREALEFPLDSRNRFSHGIWSDGATVWVADSGQDRLFAYDLKTGERIMEREFELGEDNRDPRGIWSDGETIYVLDSVGDRLYAYDLESGELLASFALDPLNQNPRGIWSDGVTIWISDDGANRVLAYRLVDGELVRFESEEFDFRVLSKAGNGEARGVWSDGDVLWVADEEDAEILSYNLPDATQARLASLSLSGVAIDFSGDRFAYSVESGGVTQTTVEAVATQPLAAVEIVPADANSERAGHQVDLAASARIAVTVTSADGSRVRTYEVTVQQTSCLNGALDSPISEVSYSGGTVAQLADCGRQLGISAVYHLDQGVWAALFLGSGLPDFLSQSFRDRFPDGLPANERLIIKREIP